MGRSLELFLAGYAGQFRGTNIQSNHKILYDYYKNLFPDIACIPDFQELNHLLPPIILIPGTQNDFGWNSILVETIINKITLILGFIPIGTSEILKLNEKNYRARLKRVLKNNTHKYYRVSIVLEWDAMFEEKEVSLARRLKDLIEDV